MKQNKIFSYVKRKNNGEGVDGNEQCSWNVIEVPYPKRTRCNSTAKVRKWDDIRLRYGLFLRNFECSRHIPEMQEQPSHYICWFLTSVITVYLLKYLINKYLIFIQIIRVFKFLLMGVPGQTRKYIRGSMMTKSLKSSDVRETRDICFEAHFALRLGGHIDMLFFRCFVCNLWFLFIVRVNVVSCRATL